MGFRVLEVGWADALGVVLAVGREGELHGEFLEVRYGILGDVVDGLGGFDHKHLHLLQHFVKLDAVFDLNVALRCRGHLLARALLFGSLFFYAYWVLDFIS